MVDIGNNQMCVEMQACLFLMFYVSRTILKCEHDRAYVTMQRYIFTNECALYENCSISSVNKLEAAECA